MGETAKVIGRGTGWLLLVGGLLLGAIGLLYAGLAASPRNLQSNELGDVGIGLGGLVAASGLLAALLGALVLVLLQKRQPKHFLRMPKA